MVIVEPHRGDLRWRRGVCVVGGETRGGQMNHKDGGIKNFPTAPLQGWRNLPPASAEARLCVFCLSFPPPLNVSLAFSSAAQGGVRGALNAKYALHGEVAEWGPPGDILSLHTARNHPPPPPTPHPIREQRRPSFVSAWTLVGGS